MKLAAAAALLIPGCFAGCHNIPTDINADEITSSITTPIFSHQITVKGLIASSYPEPITETPKNKK